MCDKLVTGGFLERQQLEIDTNCFVFPKLKTTQKCSFIVDMRNIIEQQSYKPAKC